MSSWKEILIFWMVVHKSAENELQSSCAPIFDASMMTLSTKINLEFIGRNEYDACECRTALKQFSACYSNNVRIIPCKKIPKNITITTSALLVESTGIEKLEVGDLEFLTHLNTLAINGNQHFHHVDSFVFENMTKLRSLSFIFNPSLSSLASNTFHGLVNLKELNLIKNGFHSIGTFIESIRPNILPKLCSLNLSENKFVNISEHDLELMEGSILKVLNINLCRIEKIDPRTLQPLKFLETLRIGDNRFDFDILSELLNETLNMGIDIKSLDLHSSGFRAFLPNNLLKILAESNISSLVLARNQFDIIDKNTFPIQMPNLLSLDLKDVSLGTIDGEVFSTIPNLKTLYLGKNRLTHFAASKHLSNLIQLDLSENVGAYGSEFILSKSEFRRLSLRNLDLQHTPLIFLRNTDFTNMTQLRTLNLDNCSIVRMDDFLFKDLNSLTLLNLENNRMFYVCKKIPFNIFAGLENLEKLLLGGNGLYKISGPTGYMFKYLKNLKHLGLERNSITSISFKDFAPLTNLQVLDISFNHLSSWDDRVFLNNILLEFHATANKMTYLSDSMLQDFRNLTHIEINFNSFICDCRIMNKMSTNKTALTGFLDLIEDQNVLCEKSSNKTLKNFIRNVTSSALNCEKKVSALVFIIPSSVFFFFAAVLGILGYRYRWHIRYWAFLVKLFLIRKGRAKNILGKRINKNYQYDAFVSYCSQDRNFVLDLVQMLENYEPYLKLCVYERDFQVGSVISESIREHIEKSRKTLLIVSNSYAKSNWCAWETQIAEHHRLFSENPCGDIVDESIVLIKLGLVDGVHLTPTLKYLLKTRIYLEWQTLDEKREVFWQKLRQFLSPPETQITNNTRV